MMSPSQELLINTDPSEVAFFHTRIVEQAEASGVIQTSIPRTAPINMNCSLILHLRSLMLCSLTRAYMFLAIELSSIAHYPAPTAFDLAAAFVVSTPL